MVESIKAVTGLQVAMLGKLAKVYGTDFRQQQARQIVSPLTSLADDAAVTAGSMVGLGATVLRCAPVLGIPVMAYFTFASTIASACCWSSG